MRAGGDARQENGWVDRMQTRELAQARAYLADRICDHRLDARDDEQAFDFQHSAFEVGQFKFNMLHYGSAVSIAANFDECYMLEMPLEGGVDIEFGNDRFRTDLGLALLLSPGPRFVSRWRPGTRQLMLQIHRDLVRQRMSEMARREPASLPVFNPMIDLRGEGGRQVKAVLGQLAAHAVNAETPDEFELDQMIRRLLDGLLRDLAFRQGDSIVFERLHATPRQVKMALDLFRARYGERLSMPAVAREVGVSERSLFDGFHRYYQRSPLSVLNDIRLEHARRLIRDGASVAGAARHVGMPHAGRFSAAYKRAFGISPSSDRA